MGVASFAIKNLDDLRDGFKNFGKTLSGNVIKGNMRMAHAIRDKARKFAPHKSGNLRAGIIALPIGTWKTFRIISKKPAGSRTFNGIGYNVLQEYGVRPNPMFAYVKGYGMIKVSPKDRGNYPPCHKGFKGHFYMYKAFKWAEKEYPTRFKKTVSQTVKSTFG